MMASRDLTVLAGLIVIFAAAIVGCQGQAAASLPSGARNIEFDPCAERLHDLCGRLLLYYKAHEEFPKRLANLEKDASHPSCPKSAKTYVYNPDGLEAAHLPGRLIIYDAVPCHSGMRYGILAEPAKPGKPLIVRVVPFLETAFHWQSEPVNP